MDNKEIPINKEVKYVTPAPIKAIEDFDPILLDNNFYPVCY